MNYKVTLGIFLFYFIHVRCAIVPIKSSNNGKAGLQENSFTGGQRIYLGQSTEPHNTVVTSPLRAAINKRLCDQCKRKPQCMDHGDCAQCIRYCETDGTETKRDVGDVEVARDEHQEPNDEVVQMVHNPNVDNGPLEEDSDAQREAEFKEGKKHHHSKDHHHESRYYTMGALNPGKALNILLTMSNVEKTDAVDKAVILIKSQIPLKFDERLLEKIGDRAFLKIFEKELARAEELRGKKRLSNEEMDNIIDYAIETVHNGHKEKDMETVGMEKAAENDTVGCSNEESETVPFFPLPPPNLYRSHQPEHRHKNPVVEPEELDGLSSMEEKRAKNPGVIQGGFNMRSGGSDFGKSKLKQTDRAREIIDTISNELKGLENMNFVGSPNTVKQGTTRDMEEQETNDEQDIEKGETQAPQSQQGMMVKIVSVEDDSNEEENDEARTHKKNKKAKKMKGSHPAPYGYGYGYGNYRRENMDPTKPESTDDAFDHPDARTHKKKEKNGNYGSRYRNHEQAEGIQIPETDIKLDKNKFLSARPDLDSHDGLPKDFHDGIHAHFKKIQEANVNEQGNGVTEPIKFTHASTVHYTDDKSEESDEQDSTSIFNPQRNTAAARNEFQIVSPTVGSHWEPNDLINLQLQNRATEDTEDRDSRDGSFENVNARRGQGNNTTRLDSTLKMENMEAEGNDGSFENISARRGQGNNTTRLDSNLKMENMEAEVNDESFENNHARRGQGNNTRPIDSNLGMENEEFEGNDGSLENINARRGQGNKELNERPNIKGGPEHKKHHDHHRGRGEIDHHHQKVNGNMHLQNKGIEHHNHGHHHEKNPHEHNENHRGVHRNINNGHPQIPSKRLEEHSMNVNIHKPNPGFIVRQQEQDQDENLPGKTLMQIDDQLVDVSRGKTLFQNEEPSKVQPINEQFNSNAVVGEAETDFEPPSNIVGGLNLMDNMNVNPQNDGFIVNLNDVSTMTPDLPFQDILPMKIKPKIPVAGKIQASAPAFGENKKFEITIPNIVSSPMDDQVTEPNLGLTETPLMEMVGNDKNSVAKSIEKLITPQEQEFLHNFGKIVPAAENMNLGSDTAVYFMGNGIKLPLKVSQNGDGSLALSVDIEKLCKCKNSTCIHTREMMKQLDNNLIGTPNNEENKIVDDQEVAIDRKIRKARHHTDFSKLYKNHRRYHPLHKRSIVDTLSKNNVETEEKMPKFGSDIANSVIKESSDEIGFHNIKDIHKFAQTAKELEKKLEKLDKDVEKSNREYDTLLQKGAKDFLPIKDEDQVVKQRIELVNHFLNWAREMTKGVTIENEDNFF